MTVSQEESIEEIADYYGRVAQDNLLIEECAELIQAINKYHRAFNHGSSEEIYKAYDNFVEEIADVEIMLAQAKYLHDIPKGMIENIMGHKIDRTLKRMREEK